MSQTEATNGRGGLLSCCSGEGRAAAQSSPTSHRAAPGTAGEGKHIQAATGLAQMHFEINGNGLGNSIATICNQICNTCCIISGL